MSDLLGNHMFSLISLIAFTLRFMSSRGLTFYNAMKKE